MTATTSGAEARGWRGGGFHHHGGFYRGRGFGIGAGIATGLALGAIGGAYYGGYGYYGDGCIRNRVVGYTAYGRPVVRPVNVCY
jgi:hypothetical protein